MKKIYSLITGTGSYVPSKIVKNDDFLNYNFLESTGEKIDRANREIVDKFEEITTISERRYAEDHQVTSDLALIAAEQAIKSAGIDKEELDYLIFAHNFGETLPNDTRIDILPTLASRVKAKLGIKSPHAIAYDILYGCPGWVQALIQSDYYIRSGDAKKVLVSVRYCREIADRTKRQHEYADGAGAAIVEAVERRIHLWNYRT